MRPRGVCTLAGVGASARGKIAGPLLLALAAALCTGCKDGGGEAKKPAAAAGVQRPLLVGVVGPETGEESAYGTSVVAGVLAAAGRFNAQGGVGGRPIDVLHFDDKSDVELTDQIVRDLVERRVLAILSAPTGSSTFAPIHRVNESETLFFAIGTRRHLKASGQYVFRAAVPEELATDDLVRFAIAEKGYANFGVVTASNDDYSLELSAMFRRALAHHQGVIRVHADSYDTYTGGQNLGAVVEALRRAADGLHAVIFTGGARDAVLLAQQMRRAGLRLPLLGGEELFAEEYLKGGDAVLGTLLYATFSAERNAPKVQEFLKDLGPAKADRFAALAYDTFTLLGEAIRQSGSTETARIREALIGRKAFEGATGATSFTPDNRPIKHPLLYTIGKREDGASAFLLLKSGASRGS